MDGVKVALGCKRMTVKAARQYAKVRKEWRAQGPDVRKAIKLRHVAVRKT